MTDQQQQHVWEARPLPGTAEEMMKARAKRGGRLLDQIDAVHCALFDDKKYQRLLFAVHDTQSVEGRTTYDDTMAALMIRAKADEMKYREVVDAPLLDVVDDLRKVLKRYHLSRRERRIANGHNATTTASEG